MKYKRAKQLAQHKTNADAFEEKMFISKKTADSN